MYCILNIHHDTGASSTAWLIASEADYAKQKERYEEVWRQIAEEFKDYDEHLLFEGYNEMLDAQSSWNFAQSSAAYTAINNYAQSFVNVVRATGGNNAQRNLIVNTYGSCSGSGTWSSHLQDPLKQMKLPEDAAKDHLLFEIHSYLDVKNLNNAKKEVDQMISDVKTNLMAKGAPVIFGEWGTSTENGYESYRSNMLAFARYFVQQATINGIGTFYWMGLSDGNHRSVPEFNQKDLVEALRTGYYAKGGGETAVTSQESTLQAHSDIYDLKGRKTGPNAAPRKGLYVVRSGGKGRKVLAK
jgi:aryl-phospho-beta-D-glucosidase BglC (GH1 family)